MNQIANNYISMAKKDDPIAKIYKELEILLKELHSEPDSDRRYILSLSIQIKIDKLEFFMEGLKNYPNTEKLRKNIEYQIKFSNKLRSLIQEAWSLGEETI